jgi:hypothetical protein
MKLKAIHSFSYLPLEPGIVSDGDITDFLYTETVNSRDGVGERWIVVVTEGPKVDDAIVLLGTK